MPSTIDPSQYLFSATVRLPSLLLPFPLVISISAIKLIFSYWHIKYSVWFSFVIRLQFPFIVQVMDVDGGVEVRGRIINCWADTKQNYYYYGSYVIAEISLVVVTFSYAYFLAKLTFFSLPFSPKQTEYTHKLRPAQTHTAYQPPSTTPAPTILSTPPKPSTSPKWLTILPSYTIWTSVGVKISNVLLRQAISMFVREIFWEISDERLYCYWDFMVILSKMYRWRIESAERMQILLLASSWTTRYLTISAYQPNSRAARSITSRLV